MKQNTETTRASCRLAMATALQIVVQIWACPTHAEDQSLTSQSGPVEPNFAAYYEPWESEVKPNVTSYDLPLDLHLLTNYNRVNQVLNVDPVRHLISQNGFVVMEHDFGSCSPSGDNIETPYEYLRDRSVPLFLTADTLLHFYHVQFNETLIEIEQREFVDDIRVLTDALLDEALQLYDQLDGDLQEAARRNVAYLGVAGQLIGLASSVPEIVSDEVTSELAKIEQHSGFADSDIFIYKEDYSQYVPRGHYSRNEEFERYFRTMMWYGRMAFLLKGHENWGPYPWNEALISPSDAGIQTLQACLLAISLNTQQVDDRSTREIWDRIYRVTAFYVGLADDLTPYDYLWALDRVFGPNYVVTGLEDPNQLHELKTELALLPSPQIFGGTGKIAIAPPSTEATLNEAVDNTKGLRLMGQRFVPDSHMFQNLLAPQTGNYAGDPARMPFTAVFAQNAGIIRGYPRGLDLMALLGSEEAREILIQEGDTDYEGYGDCFGRLTEQLGALSAEAWNRNLYWSWLYSLQALISGYGDGYPTFMQATPWAKRSLNVALASWTELRHDTILYAKQSYSFGDISAPPSPPCYVEPVPEFFGRLLALTQMTHRGLSDIVALSDRAKNGFASLEEILNRLIEIATKELTNQPPSPEDKGYLLYLATDMQWIVTGYDKFSGEALSTILVADVHTNIIEEKVLEEAVGKVDLIVVACPQSDGSAFLAAGPVLSYYEFKHPMEDRLTDEKWRELLESPEKPERPAWYRPLMR